MGLDERNGRLRRIVLECTSQATRPLRVLELADAISLTDPLGQRSKPDLSVSKEAIRDVCTPPLGLSVLDTVSLADGDTKPELGVAHARLAKICVEYLSSEEALSIDFNKLHSSLGGVGRSQETEPPFLEYAFENWLFHVKQATESGSDMSELYAILDDLLVGEKARKLAPVRGARLPVYYENGDWGDSPALVLAVAHGLTGYAQYLLQKPRATAPREFISFWSGEGSEAMVSLLLEHGADLQEHDRDGFRPLHQAVRHSHPNIVACLLKAGADLCQLSVSMPSEVDGPGNVTPEFSSIELACNDGHTEIVGLLMQKVNSADTVNFALTAAVEGKWDGEAGNGNAATVRLVLEHPLVNVDARVHHYTPLYIACMARNLEVIQTLLEYGADVNFLHDPIHAHVGRPVPGKGDTALHALAQGTWERCFTYVEDLSPSDAERLVQCFDLLLKAGAQVNQQNPEGYIPLHVAVNFTAVKCLVDAGADVNALGFYGETFLHKMVSTLVPGWKQPSPALQQILSQVLDYVGDRIDLNVQARRSLETPLSMIIKAGGFEIAERLLQMGGDVSLLDSQGAGPLHWTMKHVKSGRGLEPFIEKILSLGADPKLLDKKRQTPLDYLFDISPALQEADNVDVYTKVASLLIDAGADLERVDDDVRTPLFQAVRLRNLESMEGRSK